MQHATFSSTTAPVQADCLHSNFASGESVKGQPTPVTRAGLVLQAIADGRTLTDAEIRQHAMDCAFLMERSYARFSEFGDESGREEAIAWDLRRKDALKSLSPEWRAAREAQILADIAAGGHLQARAELAKGSM